MSDRFLDIGYLAAVPESERLDHDESGDPEAMSDASDGGVDDDLDDIYADPGVVVTEDLG